MLIKILEKKIVIEEKKIIFGQWPIDPLTCATDTWLVSATQVVGLQRMRPLFFKKKKSVKDFV